MPLGVAPVSAQREAGVVQSDAPVPRPLPPLDVPQGAPHGRLLETTAALERVQEVMARLLPPPRGRPLALPLLPVRDGRGGATLAPPSTAPTSVVLAAAVATRRLAPRPAVVGAQ